jgi:transcriptional regulator
MYIPEAFKLSDRPACHRVMRENNFGILVTRSEAAPPFATHLAFFLKPDAGPNGTLVSHVAAANPQIKDLASGKQALVIFHGPHAYVSPGWYESQPAVPTWNYIAVHAYGIPRVIDDPAAVRAALEELVEENEHQGGSGWRVSNLPDAFFASKAGGIVVFELPIDRLEGKAKLSQNRTAEDRAGVVAALERSPDPSARGIAQAMRSRGD